MNNENETNLISGVVNANGDESATIGNENTTEIAADSEVSAAKPDGADSAVTTAESEQPEFDSDIVERIIDRVVERIAPRIAANNEATTDEPEVQRCATPNFLSDIRPDFWDRP